MDRSATLGNMNKADFANSLPRKYDPSKFLLLILSGIKITKKNNVFSKDLDKSIYMCKEKPDPSAAETNNTGEEAIESSRTNQKYVFTEPMRAHTEASVGRDFKGTTFTFSKERKKSNPTVGSDYEEDQSEHEEESEADEENFGADFDDDESLCIICFTNQANSVLLDCGHGGVCIECSLDAMKQNNVCVLCRKEVN